MKILLDEVVDSIDTITKDILGALTLEECVDVFRAYNNIESFFSWQIICDLMELNIVKMEENSWVLLGPGARAGLRQASSNFS